MTDTELENRPCHATTAAAFLSCGRVIAPACADRIHQHITVVLSFAAETSSMSNPRLHKRLGHFALGLFFLVTLAGSASAQGKYNKMLAIGDQAPGWQDLLGTDDARHSLEELNDCEVIVVCFTSNTCLYSVDYEDRLIALQKKYADSDDVRVVAINSNAVKADDLDHMKERAGEKKFPFLYLRDDDQSVARTWGAIYTPEFFVLNRKRQVVYMGAMDDSTNPDGVMTRYVELAVDATLIHSDIEHTETAARGCAIRMPRRRKPVPDPISQPDR